VFLICTPRSELAAVIACPQDAGPERGHKSILGLGVIAAVDAWPLNTIVSIARAEGIKSIDGSYPWSEFLHGRALP
jgi:hypothetical protein